MNNEDIKIKIIQDDTNDLGVFHIKQDELEIKVEQDSNYADLDVAIVTGSSGITQVYHDEDFTGTGKSSDPISLSDTFWDKIDEKQDILTPGPGIEINENNVITTTNGYVFEQGIASDTWVINHNLNKKPVVVVVDSADSVVQASVEYNGLNTCTVKMKYAFKGTAYLT